MRQRPANLGAEWDAEGVPHVQNQGCDQCDQAEESTQRPDHETLQNDQCPSHEDILSP